MSRLAAFSLLGCAAFDLALPWLDRPGTAALGLAFFAWSTGRGFGFRRRAQAPLPFQLPDLEPLTDDGLGDARRDALSAY